ncbi:Swi3-domain-containing protein [Dichomitus squalens]|uniref:Chromosome segregation in meiosis protein n=1 Tax=Dichomitus squalens TaxID=114155 RepID=A0A4Q9QDI7_9APHY|nr:Swi3-domain-containing protein [Dichomitus squalens]
MASLDDIWDAPAESASTAPTSAPILIDDDDDDSTSHPKPPARPRSTLFLDSGSEDDAPSTSKTHYASRPGSSKPDIDAFFDDLDDPETAFQALAPSLDVDTLKRQAGANLPPLTPHQILPSSSPPRDLGGDKAGAKSKADGRKGEKGTTTARKKRPVLDEGRLLGPQGFPALMKQTKNFKPKGKGHELSDLNRLLTVYHFWAHEMYPNAQFIDTVQRVEKLCHSKRMHVALGVWRDEAKGLINGHKLPDPNASDDSSDSDTDQEDPHAAPATDVPVATEDERSSPAPSRGPSLPPTSASEGGLDDDFDIDAMIAEDEAARARAPIDTSSRPQPTGAPAAADEDEEMWDAVMADFPDEPYVPPDRQPRAPAAKPPVRAQAAHEGEDEDMWDIVREMEAEAAAKVAAGDPPSDGPPSGGTTGLAGVDPTRPASNDEGWDEMYA